MQGHETNGYRLFHEAQTTIVALMRGGEPMALSVSDAFPRAMFVHAGAPDDVLPHHLQGQINVVLVDAVVNSGATLLGFVQQMRALHATVRVVAVAGVAQARAVEGDGACARELARAANLRVVALRLSENRFAGRGATDTGNRLFNTTRLA